MNKSDLVEILIKKNSKLTKKDIEESINLLLNFFSYQISKGNRIELRGFGSFSTRKRKARFARNPKTGTSIKVEGKSHPYFRASKELKASLKN